MLTFGILAVAISRTLFPQRSTFDAIRCTSLSRRHVSGATLELTVSRHWLLRVGSTNLLAKDSRDLSNQPLLLIERYGIHSNPHVKVRLPLPSSDHE